MTVESQEELTRSVKEWCREHGAKLVMAGRRYDNAEGVWLITVRFRNGRLMSLHARQQSVLLADLERFGAIVGA